MFVRLAVTIAVASVVLSAPTTATANHHPRLHAALYEMREAHRELKGANHNFGGHRERALADLDAAIAQTEKALVAAGDPYRSFAPGKGLYNHYKTHPHLQHALRAMQDARAELTPQNQNFGVHRAKALAALDAAIVQVEKCIQHLNK